MKIDLHHHWSSVVKLFSHYRLLSLSPFATPDYLQTWWQHFGQGELQIVTFYDDEQLVGVAPLFLFQNQAGKQQLSLIGHVDDQANLSDYLDMIFDPKYESELYQELIKFLSTDQIKWVELNLTSIQEKSATLKHLAQLAQKNNWQLARRQQDICPVITLPTSWDEYLVQLDRKQRHEVKRKQRRVEETNHQVVTLTKPDEVAQAMPDFIRLHQLSSQEKKDFWSEDHLNFFQELAEKFAQQDWLRLNFLVIDQQKVASNMIFDFNNQFYLYNSGYDPDPKYNFLSTGWVLTTHTINQAIKLKKNRYDFLRGEEKYKFLLGGKAEPIYDLTISKTG